MQLYQINQNGNKYCGPSVVSAVAGIGTKEAAAIMRNRSDKTAIRGTHAHEVRHALTELGFSMLPMSYPLNSIAAFKKVTLRQWSKSFAKGSDVYLVAAGKHWILVQGRYAMCGKTIDLVPVADHSHARCYVTEAYRITKERNVDPATLLKKVARARPAPPLNSIGNYSYKRKTEQLAEQHGIELDTTDHSVWVYPPSWIEGDNDPYDDEHYCYDWSEALKRVNEYIELIGKLAHLKPAEPTDEAA